MGEFVFGALVGGLVVACVWPVRVRRLRRQVALERQGRLWGEGVAQKHRDLLFRIRLLSVEMDDGEGAGLLALLLDEDGVNRG